MGRHQNKKVWLYFDKISETTARCKRCNVHISCKYTTGNLVRHLYNRHKVDASNHGAENTGFLKTPKSKRSHKPDTCASDSDNQNVSKSSGCFDPLDVIIKTEIEESKGDKNVNGFDEDESLWDEFTVQPPVPTASENINELNGDKSCHHEMDPNIKSFHAEKLKAETRYYNEMAELARAKREMIELQSKRMKLEIQKLINI